MSKQTGKAHRTKYRDVITYIEQAISQGQLAEGSRLPSESELVKELGASRPTISRAMRELKLLGRIERRAGSGSFVAKSAKSEKHRLFGLLIPRLGQTEIFNSVCHQIAREADSARFGLLWAHQSASIEDHLSAERACEPYLHQKVSGVFFAPLELSAAQDQINAKIVEILGKAKIPVVLLDRDYSPFPRRSNCDLVGIDNFAAGYMLAEHLLDCGAKNIAFVARPFSAGTVQGRIAGVLAAMTHRKVRPADPWVHIIEASDLDAVKQLVGGKRPDAVICANDKTAAELMRSLEQLGFDVPKQIQIAGIDDVHYAQLLKPALTTMHQPCQSIGTVAMQVMLERIARPDAPVRHVMLPASLVVRESTCRATPR